MTAAALIMFFVFFAFVPEGSGTIKPIALGLAVGIAFDAFLVRMTLVPAIMALLGRAAWWMPQWLGRMLPNMDIEGEDLRNHRAAVLWSQGRAGSVISTEDLVVGSGEHRSAPVSVDIPAGALVLVAGSRPTAGRSPGRWPADCCRSPVAHTSAGIRCPRNPSAWPELWRWRRPVEKIAPPPPVSVGDVLDSRLRITVPWYRVFGRRALVRHWISRLGEVLGGGTGTGSVVLDAGTELAHLGPLERAVTLAAVALAERPRVLMLEHGGRVLLISWA